MKPRVLVVDDSLTVRVDLRDALTLAGFLVTSAETKADALREFSRGSFAAIVLDVILPDGDGIDLLRKIKRDPRKSRTPVLLLSTETEVRDRVRGLSLGAADYAGKPYNRDYVVRRISELSGVSTTHADPRAVGRKILIVDDSSTFLRSVSRLLRFDRHDLILARSGEEALALLEVQDVDAVILDVEMPGIGGIETCRRIRTLPRGEQIIVLMVTANEEPEIVRESMAAGVDEFMHKSTALSVLRGRLQKLLSADRQTKSGRSPSGEPASRARPPLLPSLFDEVVAASGLLTTIAPTTIERACRRAGVAARTMRPSELERALPLIRQALGVFLSPDEADQRAAALAALARRSDLT